MNITKRVSGVAYLQQVSHSGSCTGCAASDDHSLCSRLAIRCEDTGQLCPGYVWALDDTKDYNAPAISQKRIEECAAAMTVELALAVQQAGGSVDILKSMTVLEFVSTCARNNIELKARWMK